MARFPIVGAVAYAVTDFLNTEFKRAGVKAEVVDTLPAEATKEPRLHFVLFDARQNLDRRDMEPISERERLKDGTIVDYLRDPPIYMDLSYLLFSNGPPAAAHAALAMAVLLIKDHPLLDDLPAIKDLYGSREESMALRLIHAYEPESIARIMRDMGITARPALVYSCSARVESENRREVRRVEERLVDIRRKERE
jgi:hypothetical protein